MKVLLTLANKDEEWGNFSLNELQSVSLHGLTVERNLYFKQGTFSEALSRLDLFQRSSITFARYSTAN